MYLSAFIYTSSKKISSVIACALFDVIGIKYQFVYSMVFFIAATVSAFFAVTTGKEGTKEVT